MIKLCFDNLLNNLQFHLVYLTKRIKSKCKLIQISNSSNIIFNLIFFYIKNPQKYAEKEIAFKINFKHLMFNNYSIITLITNIINKSWVTEHAKVVIKFKT